MHIHTYTYLRTAWCWSACLETILFYIAIDVIHATITMHSTCTTHTYYVCILWVPCTLSTLRMLSILPILRIVCILSTMHTMSHTLHTHSSVMPRASHHRSCCTTTTLTGMAVGASSASGSACITRGSASALWYTLQDVTKGSVHIA